MLNAFVTLLGHFPAELGVGSGPKMDSYQEHPRDFDVPFSDEAAANDVASMIGTDERRMHVRAYNYWVSLLNGRDFPSIEDLEPSDVQDFSSNSVLLDFTCGRDNPAIPYVGAAIRAECGVDDDMRTISEVPSRSLLSRLTDHYMQIIANRAPVGFEAEFDNPAGDTICYRGILMPFSSDGDAIDFIYGVMNWKRVGDEMSDAGGAPVAEASRIEIAGIEDTNSSSSGAEEEPLELTEVLEPVPLSMIEDARGEIPELAPTSDDESVEVDAFAGSPDEQRSFAPEQGSAEAGAAHFSWEDGPLGEGDDAPIIELDEDAGLADRLWAARETAESVKAGEGRTRAALYEALALAYDFALAAQQKPQDYAELLEESGVKAQARAPMTPIVKLVFGIDYDKARLTEFAAALSYAQRREIPFGAFNDFIEKQPGGLKGLVAAERQARRPDAKPDAKGEVARARLRSAESISLADLSTESEFALVVTRRTADGSHEAVAVIEDEALIERAIRRTA